MPVEKEVCELFKVAAKVNGRKCKVLIDCGASSNFMSWEMAKELHVDTGQECGIVDMANGTSNNIPATLSKRVNLRLGRFVFNMPFTITDLRKDYDMILGMPWLKQHDPAITWSTRELLLRFGKEQLVVRAEQLCKLNSQPTVSIQQVSVKVIRKDLAKQGTEALLFLIREKTTPTKARRQTEELLQKGYIRPLKSPYGAPILFTKKKNGKLRMCIDYRGLNSITKRNGYPLPRIDELLEQLAGAQYFSKIDLAAGYHQIRVAPEDIKKTAFNTSCTREDYLHKLQQVFDRLRSQKLYAQLSKCEFLTTSIEYLGHIVDKHGIKVDPAKMPLTRQLVQYCSRTRGRECTRQHTSAGS